MSGEYVRSCTDRQEKASDDCWRCEIKDKRIAELEAELEALKKWRSNVSQKALQVLQPDGTENGVGWCSIWGEDLDALQVALQEKGDE